MTAVTSPVSNHPRFDAILFDCDGVLVDSEPLVNRLIWEMLTELGISISPEDSIKRFLGKALKGLKSWDLPQVINTDKAPTYAAALGELKKEGKCPEDTVHRQVKYLTDHGKLKQLIRPVRGFKTLKTAYATIKSFEVMRWFCRNFGRQIRLVYVCRQRFRRRAGDDRVQGQSF